MSDLETKGSEFCKCENPGPFYLSEFGRTCCCCDRKSKESDSLPVPIPKPKPKIKEPKLNIIKEKTSLKEEIKWWFEELHRVLFNPSYMDIILNIILWGFIIFSGVFTVILLFVLL